MKILVSPLALALVCVASSAQAQVGAHAEAIPGPDLPLAPETVTRSADGGVTVRAVRVVMPIKVDGRLEEAVYRDVLPITGFIQTEPTTGAPATERTEAWVLYDDKAIYLTFRCWESQVGWRVANEMRHDNATISDNDHVAFILDTYFDRTNAVYFAINSLGGRLEGQFSGFQYNVDWNRVWSSEAGSFEEGWTVEVAVPFTSLRYRPGRDQVWGINR